MHDHASSPYFSMQKLQNCVIVHDHGSLPYSSIKQITKLCDRARSHLIPQILRHNSSTKHVIVHDHRYLHCTNQKSLWASTHFKTSSSKTLSYHMIHSSLSRNAQKVKRPNRRSPCPGTIEEYFWWVFDYLKLGNIDSRDRRLCYCL